MVLVAIVALALLLGACFGFAGGMLYLHTRDRRGYGDVDEQI